MACICEDDGIDADCEVHGTMSEQEQPPLDWKWLEESIDFILGPDADPTIYTKSYKKLATQARALVTALKAEREKSGIDWGKVDMIEITGDPKLDRAALSRSQVRRLAAQGTAEPLIKEIEQLRADLARVVADAKKWREEAEQIHREDTELESLYEAAQARIAELEGSLRALYGTHSIPFGSSERDGPCWCGDCERARANLAEPQTPTAS